MKDCDLDLCNDESIWKNKNFQTKIPSELHVNKTIRLDSLIGSYFYIREQSVAAMEYGLPLGYRIKEPLHSGHVQISLL